MADNSLLSALLDSVLAKDRAKEGMSAPPGTVFPSVSSPSMMPMGQDIYADRGPRYSEGSPEILQRLMAGTPKTSVTPPATGEEQTTPPQKNNDTMKMILKYAPLFAAGIAGLTSKRALPGAAGFASGYSNELQRQSQAGSDKTPVYVYDKNNNIIPALDAQGNPVLLPKNATIKNASSAEKTPTDLELERLATSRVNAFLNQNPVLQAQLFNNPLQYQDMLDKEVARLRQKYVADSTDMGLGSQNNAVQQGGQGSAVGASFEKKLQYTMQKYGLSREEVLRLYEERGRGGANAQ